jgi:hypothetical protein
MFLLFFRKITCTERKLLNWKANEETNIREKTLYLNTPCYYFYVIHTVDVLIIHTLTD